MADKKKVLVTGLSGLVGTALRDEFDKRYELSSLSRYGTEGMDDAHNFKGNIAELDTIRKCEEAFMSVAKRANPRFDRDHFTEFVQEIRRYERDLDGKKIKRASVTA